MIQDLEQKMNLIKEIADRNALLASQILTDEQVEAVSTLIGMALIEYDAHIRAIDHVKRFKLDDSFKKRLEEVVVSDTPAYSWMDEYRKEYDAALTSGMFFEWFPTFTGVWDRDKYAFCHDRKYKKLSPQDPAVYTKRDNTTIEDQMNLYREMTDKEIERMNIEEYDRVFNAILDEEIGEETDEEKAYRMGWINGYDEGFYDGQYK